MEETIKMYFMLPDRDKLKEWFRRDTLQSFHIVSKKVFLAEWKKNGLFEDVIGLYNNGNLCLYIKPINKEYDYIKSEWKERKKIYGINKARKN